MLPYAPWLCWLIPILGMAVTTLTGVVRRRLSSYLAVFSVGLSALFCFSMIPDVVAGNVFSLRSSWLFSQLELMVDPLSVLMASVISCIGFLVTLFSVVYMQKDSSLIRFWFLIQLFIGGYVMIVMADNLLFMFIGWEMVGISCTGLAAFWYRDPEKAHIGLKTFLILRVSDVLLLASILVMYASAQTFTITELSQNSDWMQQMSGSGLLSVTAFMFFGGVVGKAAQFPLQEWLPDALAASPSSFNALTECLAGPFIMARVLPIFHQAAITGYGEIVSFFLVVTLVGTLSAVISALLAMVQTNIFKTISYSVSSVIGYMIVAYGLAGLMRDFRWGYLAGTFLLTVDAFVSALLFLTAAYIFYATGSNSLHEMSGFKSRLAHRSMEVGALAIGGIPPLSGFWCTNWIQTISLDFAAEAGLNGHFALMISGYSFFVLLIIASAITAFYALRMLGLIFGRQSQVFSERTVRKPSFLMRCSLITTLAVTSFLDFLAIFLILPFDMFLLQDRSVFNSFIAVLAYIVPTISTVLTCAAVAFGGYIAYRIYLTREVDVVDLVERHWFLKTGHRLLRRRLYIDALYYKVANFVMFVSHEMHNSLERLLDLFNVFLAARFLSFSKLVYKYVETEGISTPEIKGFGRFYEMISRRVVSLSRWAYPHVELGGFETFNRKFAKALAYLSSKIRRTQTGLLSYNMLTVAIGTVLIMVLLMKFGGLL